MVSEGDFRSNGWWVFCTKENNSNNNNNNNFGIQWRQRQRWFSTKCRDQRNAGTGTGTGTGTYSDHFFPKWLLLCCCCCCCCLCSCLFSFFLLRTFFQCFCSCYRITMQWPKSMHMNSPVAVWCLIWLRHDFACFFLMALVFRKEQQQQQHSCTLHRIHGNFFFSITHLMKQQQHRQLLLVFILAVFFLLFAPRFALLFLSVLLFFLRCSEKIWFHPDHSSCNICFFLPCDRGPVSNAKMQKHTWCHAINYNIGEQRTCSM